jgi:3-methyladenine DNA glycosylase AlkD
MNEHHRNLVAAIKKSGRSRVHSQANDNYLASGHHYYDVSIPTLRALAKEWLKSNKGIADEEFIAVLDGLYSGKSYEEKVLASMLIAGNHAGRRMLGPKRLDVWLNGLAGWAEIDSLCASAFTAAEMLAEWPAWKRFIQRLARDRNINKRRAALVFLTTATRKSDDARLAALALETIEALKPEREIIITKALSWLLRSMVVRHKSMVAAYIKDKRNSLPAIAVRETTRKIATGRK